jgi:hypothetical protein
MEELQITSLYLMKLLLFSEQQKKKKNVRIYDADHSVLKAFSGTRQEKKEKEV